MAEPALSRTRHCGGGSARAVCGRVRAAAPRVGASPSKAATNPVLRGQVLRLVVQRVRAGLLLMAEDVDGVTESELNDLMRNMQAQQLPKPMRPQTSIGGCTS